MWELHCLQLLSVTEVREPSNRVPSAESYGHWQNGRKASKIQTICYFNLKTSFGPNEATLDTQCNPLEIRGIIVENGKPHRLWPLSKGSNLKFISPFHLLLLWTHYPGWSWGENQVLSSLYVFWKIKWCTSIFWSGFLQGRMNGLISHDGAVYFCNGASGYAFLLGFEKLLRSPSFRTWYLDPGHIIELTQVYLHPGKGFQQLCDYFWLKIWWSLGWLN